MFRLAMPALLIATGLLTGAATAQHGDRAEAQLEKALRGLKPGAPQDCLARERVGETRNFPGTILYVEGRNRVWRNQVVGYCAGLASDDLVVVTSISGRLCSGDIVQTRARIGGNITGSCSLGKFVPYTK